MKKRAINKLALIISILLISVFLVSACDSDDPRILVAHYYSPGAPFATNIAILDKDGNPDPRRQIRCTIVFEVVDERAVEELEGVTFKVRSSVLALLGELTVEEITIHRDFEDLSKRLIERINNDLPTEYELIKKAFFTEFVLV